MSVSDLNLAFTPLLPWWALIALGLVAAAVLLYGAIRGQRGLVLRALAMASLKRMASAPEVPTLDDALSWARRFATACQCAQEVRVLADDPEV